MQPALDISILPSLVPLNWSTCSFVIHVLHLGLRINCLLLSFNRQTPNSSTLRGGAHAAWFQFSGVAGICYAAGSMASRP